MIEYLLLKSVFPSFMGIFPTPLIEIMDVKLFNLNFR